MNQIKPLYYATEISILLNKGCCTYAESEEIIKLIQNTIDIDREVAKLQNKSIEENIFPKSAHAADGMF